MTHHYNPCMNDEMVNRIAACIVGQLPIHTPDARRVLEMASRMVSLDESSMPDYEVTQGETANVKIFRRKP